MGYCLIWMKFPFLEASKMEINAIYGHLYAKASMAIRVDLFVSQYLQGPSAFRIARGCTPISRPSCRSLELWNCR